MIEHKKHILLINHYAGAPKYGMEFRSHFLAREWVKAGHSVTILGASYSHLRRTNPTASHEDIDGITYHWLKTPSYKGNGLGRILNMAAFLLQAPFKILKLGLSKKPDAIISASTYVFDGVLNLFFTKLFGSRSIHEVRDIWPKTLLEISDISPKHPFIQAMAAAETLVYKQIQYVVSALPKAIDHMQPLGLDKDRYVVIPNGMDVAEWENRTPLNAEVQNTLISLASKGFTIIGYTGTHGHANSLDALLKSAQILRDKRFAFILLGDGPIKGDLQKFANEQHLENVFFYNPVPKSEIPQLLELTHINFIGAPPSKLYEYGVSPNKLLDYLAAGKPVLYAIEAGNNIVAEAKAGMTVLSENPDAFAKALLEFQNLPDAEKRKMGANGRSYVYEYLTYQRLAEEYEKLFSTQGVIQKK